MLKKYKWWALALMLPQSAFAQQAIDFEYVSGDSTTNYSALGKPLSTYNIKQTLPRDVLDNVYSMLPEGQEVNPDFISTERYTSIDIDDELNGAEYALVSVTFLNEGAGYRNSLGYIMYPTDAPPTSVTEVPTHTIIFPNASKPADGEMLEGDTLDLEIQVPPGYTISFFVVPNGWSYAGSYHTIQNLGPWGTPFYSLPQLNPEATLINRMHTVAFVDIQNEFLIFGFEDLYRPHGDNDFNDLLFTVNVSPFTSVDGVNSDGSTSSRYEPIVKVNDPEYLITSVYPAANSWATLAFEDRWPYEGDYDFNDVAFKYRVTETLNSKRELMALSAVYQLQAMGASYHNGFAIKLPNVDPANIESVTLSLNGVTIFDEILEWSTTDTILIISNDLRDLLLTAGAIDGQCRYYRTQSACLAQQTQEFEFQLEVNLITPVGRDLIGYPPYDPFIFATEGQFHGSFIATPPGRSWETHLRSGNYTAYFDSIFFGMADDNSNLTASWINANNFPWALNITAEWVHPLESVDLSQAYPHFPTWVLSNGESRVDWMIEANANQNKIAR